MPDGSFILKMSVALYPTVHASIFELNDGNVVSSLFYKAIIAVCIQVLVRQRQSIDRSWRNFRWVEEVARPECIPGYSLFIFVTVCSHNTSFTHRSESTNIRWDEKGSKISSLLRVWSSLCDSYPFAGSEYGGSIWDGMSTGVTGCIWPTCSAQVGPTNLVGEPLLIADIITQFCFQLHRDFDCTNWWGRNYAYK